MADSIERCEWCGDDPVYVAYHDNVWGVPCHDDNVLFEMLVLEGAQAGLSWITVLRRQQAYRDAYDNFDIEKVADYKEEKIKALLSDKGIIRNRLKIQSSIQNARAVQIIQSRYGSFDSYLWGFVDNQPIQNAWSVLAELPATTPLSARLSKDLKSRGFSFVGSTICYAYMQSIGMVNDHIVSCFRYDQIRTGAR